jgi:hypothetical protein
MKKALLIIFVSLGFTSSKSQDVQGIWMSYNNRTIDIDSVSNTNTSGFIIDFNQSKIGHVYSDTLSPFVINYKEKLISIKSDTKKLGILAFYNDSIEMQIFKNRISVFHPLNLNYKIKSDKTQIENFLIKSNLKNPDQSLDIKFTNKIYFKDVIYEKTKKRKSLVNKSWDDEGYWYLKKIKGNYFLILTIEQSSSKNIYQIVSFDECKMELKQLQKPDWGGLKLNVLNTCL